MRHLPKAKKLRLRPLWRGLIGAISTNAGARWSDQKHWKKQAKKDWLHVNVSFARLCFPKKGERPFSGLKMPSSTPASAAHTSDEFFQPQRLEAASLDRQHVGA